MSSARVELSSRGQRAPFFRAPDLASADHPWAGFTFEEASGAGEPLPSHSWPKTTLLYVTGGDASLRWKHRGVWNVDPVAAGAVSIVRRDVEIQAAEPSAAFPVMVLQLDGAKFQDLAPAQVQAIDQSLGSAQGAQDAHLAALLSAMSAEVRAGCPSGRLYGESISIAFLAYLAGRYATPQREPGRDAGLSAAEMRAVVAHIQDNLAGAISVTELACLLRMSPSHFARVFKAAFGVTPYQFVMRERVAGAKRLIADAALSASQVATELGFSSQSHFAKVFRQFTGVTPKQYKAGF
jgi:AraC family transcriptional regulator